MHPEATHRGFLRWLMSAVRMLHRAEADHIIGR
jgi:hypothetical protein